MYEQKEGQGSLFKNDIKSSDKHPDYRGDCTIGGKKYWIAGWIKKGKKGSFMSLALQPKDEKNPKQSKPQDDDSIPF